MSQELELQVIKSPGVWVAEIELRYSARAARTFNCGAISPGLQAPEKDET